MPRVLCVISTLDSGPGESLLHTVRALRERFDFTICELLPRGAVNGHRARALGASVLEVGRPGSSPTALGAVLRAARDVGPDLLHGFELDTNFHASVAARRVGASMVAGFHGMESAFRRSRAPLLHWVLLSADHITCVSAAIARRCSARAPWARRRLTVVPNGVDCGDFAHHDHAPPSGTAMVTCVANFHSSMKGHEHLLRAAGLFDPEEVEIHLVGSGRLESSMRACADQLGLDDRVRFAGWRADVARVLAGSDVFVLPSTSEGTPHALLQAMASGVPVVASEVGGVPDVVEHGDSGLLVPPADPRALRDAIRRLLADDALYARLAAGGRKRVEDRFDATSAAAGMERVYGLALAA